MSISHDQRRASHTASGRSQRYRSWPALITNKGAGSFKSGKQKRIKPHVRQKHSGQRREEKAAIESRTRQEVKLQAAPDVDRWLRAGDLDPFGLSPVAMSSPNTSAWVTCGMADPAPLHSMLCSSYGHMRNFANMPIASISDVLCHKAEAIHLINQRMAEGSKALTYETLAAICVIMTVQKNLGQYNEMKLYLRGLLQMVDGGYMRGLLMGEILW